MGVVESAKAFIQAPSGDVLLLMRSADDPHRPGEWDLPGGGVEPGEKPLDAVEREIREEAGLVIDRGRLTLALSQERPSRYGHTNLRHYFVARLPELSDPVISLEHSRFVWVPPSEAASKITHPPHAEALARLIEINLLPTV